MIQVRQGKKSEIGWINQCYDEVGFIHSNFDKEIIAIAEFKGQKAGLGRLVRVDEKHLELGGMYVLDSFRGKGIAKEIVRFLLKHVYPFQTVYCIPFEHLVPFYQQFGFIPCDNLDQVPKEVLEKYLWCKEKYPDPTALLVLSQKRE